jgi:hypothetical protein
VDITAGMFGELASAPTAAVRWSAGTAPTTGLLRLAVRDAATASSQGQGAGRGTGYAYIDYIYI